MTDDAVGERPIRDEACCSGLHSEYSRKCHLSTTQLAPRKETFAYATAGVQKKAKVAQFHISAPQACEMSSKSAFKTNNK